MGFNNLFSFYRYKEWESLRAALLFLVLFGFFYQDYSNSFPIQIAGT